MIRQLAPGMVQQMQSMCSDCNGEGEPARPLDREQFKYLVRIDFLLSRGVISDLACLVSCLICTP